MNNNEIADKLDGMTRGNLQLDLFEGELWLTIRNKHRGVDIFVDGNVSPSDLLAFCREVVSKVDGEPIVMNTPRYSPAPRTFFTVEEIREWILGELIYDGNGNEPEMFKEKNRHTRFLAGYLDDKEDGIAATTERHRKDGK